MLSRNYRFFVCLSLDDHNGTQFILSQDHIHRHLRTLHYGKAYIARTTRNTLILRHITDK